MLFVHILQKGKLVCLQIITTYVWTSANWTYLHSILRNLHDANVGKNDGIVPKNEIVTLSPLAEC
jgi:hypothetical protein